MNTQDEQQQNQLKASWSLIENALELAQSKGVYRLKDAAEITKAILEIDFYLGMALQNLKSKPAAELTSEPQTSNENTQPTRKKNGQ